MSDPNVDPQPIPVPAQQTTPYQQIFGNEPATVPSNNGPAVTQGHASWPDFPQAITRTTDGPKATRGWIPTGIPYPEKQNYVKGY